MLLPRTATMSARACRHIGLDELEKLGSITSAYARIHASMLFWRIAVRSHMLMCVSVRT